jgi:hypothetical protein
MAFHPRRLRQGGDNPQSFSLEHLAERGGEDRIAIMNQEPRHAGAVPHVHGQAAGLLRRPRPGRARGHPGHVQPAGAVLDEHQHVQPLEQHRLDEKEVTGDDGMCPGGEELPPGRPGPPRRGIDAGRVQDLPHRGRGDRVSQPGQLPLDPPMAPGWVLTRHPDDQCPDRSTGRRSPWPSPARVVPRAGGKVTVPAQDRGRGDREDLRPPATCEYSWIRPPSRSRRRTRTLASGAGGTGCPAGGPCCSAHPGP